MWTPGRNTQNTPTFAINGTTRGLKLPSVTTKKPFRLVLYLNRYGNAPPRISSPKTKKANPLFSVVTDKEKAGC